MNISDDDHQVGDDHRPVEAVDRVDQELAHAGPGEDGLGDDREGDQRAELEAEHGDDRDQDVLQHVHADDAALRQALGARELARSPAAAPRACRRGRGAISERDLKSARLSAGRIRWRSPSSVRNDSCDAEAASPSRRARRRQPAEHHREHHDQHQADPEGRQREAEDRARHDRAAGERVRAQPGVQAERNAEHDRDARARRRRARASPACARGSARAPARRTRRSGRGRRAARLHEEAEYCSHSGWSRPSARDRLLALDLVGLGIDQDVDRIADRVDADEDQRRHHGDDQRLCPSRRNRKASMAVARLVPTEQISH